MKEQTIEQGRQAYRDGLDFTQCPYQEKTYSIEIAILSAWWFDGWLEESRK